LAHSKGVKVVLRPGVDPDWSNPATKGTWRGMIGNNYNATGFDIFFASYQQFIYRYALLAQEFGVDEFSVGFELVGLSKQSAHWRSTIAGVRQRFRGPIVYSGNHDGEESSDWWDAVDTIGIDAYYSLLTINPKPTVSELVRAWQPIVIRLANLSSKWNKQIVFGEVGYCSCPLSHLDPANGGCNGPNVDLDEQVNLFEALFLAVYSQPFIRGFYVWAWLTDPANGGRNNSDFTPNGKPVAEVLQRYYGKQQ